MIPTVGGIAELAPHPNQTLPEEDLRINSNSISVIVIFAHDIEASWQFYRHLFPSAWYELEPPEQRSCRMMFRKSNTDTTRSWQSAEYFELTVLECPGRDQERHEKRKGLSVVLISCDTPGIGTKCDSLYSAPAFPEITSIINALLGWPAWRADPSMEMESCYLPKIDGRLLYCTDPDGYRWRVVETGRMSIKARLGRAGGLARAPRQLATGNQIKGGLVLPLYVTRRGAWLGMEHANSNSRTVRNVRSSRKV
jgi:hypothetical protein